MNVMAPAIISIYFRGKLISKLRFVSAITQKNTKAFLKYIYTCRYKTLMQVHTLSNSKLYELKTHRILNVVRSNFNAKLESSSLLDLAQKTK